jgi:drug/metabolite transporter (DMT)-like permease
MRDFGGPNPAAVAFAVLGLIWGSNFRFMKWASETISPEQSCGRTRAPSSPSSSGWGCSEPVAYILYDVVVERLGAVTAASSTYIPPVVALVICWLVSGEPITWLDGVAVLLVLTGVIALRQRGGARRAEVAVRPA